jgi:capsid portal protein
MPENGQIQDLLNKDAATGKSKAVVANSISLDPKNPIPLDYGSDSFQVIFGKRYIPFGGFRDNLPNVLWESRLQSTTHNACVTSIAQTCIGEGLQVTNLEAEKVDKDFIKFISRINNDGHSLNKICKTILEAYLTDGNSWIELVKGEFNKKKYVKAYHHTSMVCRLSLPEKETEEVKFAIKSNALAKPRNGMLNARSLKAVTFPLYNDNPLDQQNVWSNLKTDKEADGDLHSLIHLKNDYSGFLYYGLPPSVASLRYQILEGKSAQYNIDMFDNNMVLSALLIFKSSMTEDEAKKTAEEILHTHTGQGKMGRVGVVSSEGGIDDFTYQPLDTQKEGSFIEFDQRLEQKIVTSHGWDPILAGISSQNNHPFSNGSQYVRAVFDIKKTMLLHPLSNYLIEAFVKPFIAIAAEELGKKEWLSYDLGFKHAIPFSLISDIEVNNVLVKDEGRKIIGYGPMADKGKGQEIIGTRVTETEVPGKSSNSNPPPSTK